MFVEDFQSQSVFNLMRCVGSQGTCFEEQAADCLKWVGGPHLALDPRYIQSAFGDSCATDTLLTKYAKEGLIRAPFDTPNFQYTAGKVCQLRVSSSMHVF